MAAMLVNLVLILCVVGTLGYTVREDPGNLQPKIYDLDPASSLKLKKDDLGSDYLSQQSQDLVTFVNRKLEEGMERIMTEKDDRIDRLELTIAGQMTEIKQLSEGMTSLKEEISEKDEVVKRLVTRISDLERIVKFEDIASKSETRSRSSAQFPRMYNETGLSLGKTSDSRSESKVEKISTQQLAIPETSNYQSDDSTPTHSEQRIRNDDNRFQNQLVEDNTAAFMEKRSEESPIADFSRCQQKRVVPSSFPAFHVSLSSNQAVTTDTTLKYDHEMLDQGDGYNTGTGIYMVPESGTYVITWTSLSYIHSNFQTVLVVNGAVRGSSWTDSEEINDIHQSTAIVVLTLNQGDRVFIRFGHTFANGSIISESDGGTSTFSGWKIH